MKNIHSILQEYWGFDEFRPLQEDIINAVLAGNDVLALLPTGGGKSLCYQVPALSLDGLCLVISPLIALMRDQVDSLTKKNIPALAVYSGMPFPEVKRTLEKAVHGNFKFLYLSPERLQSRLFKEYLPGMQISLVAVDEAHCVSQWGYDFRPPYLQISALRERLPSVPMLALTASATKEVQEDIIDKLALKECKNFQASFLRPHLSYSVFEPSSKQNKLIEILQNVPGSSIVYCRSRKRAKEIASLLQMQNINAGFYHAGLGHAERTERQQSWINGRTRVIACTNAFGMGIDKSNVRTVIHYDVPDALESYYQEAGRAGRDNRRAYAVLLCQPGETEELLQLSNERFPPVEEVKKVYKALVNYLQLPSGSGEGLYFDLDLPDFAKKFELDTYTAAFCLKVLEQEEYISYNEQFFLPARAEFTIVRDDLLEFEKGYPQLEPVVKGLLRSYEGIFDHPTPIFEKQLAQFIKMDVEPLKESLTTLHRYGIIDYQPQKDRPQVQFLHNRVNTADLFINVKNMEARKAAFEKRVKAMVDYVRTSDCRSQVIGTYFNDPGMDRCGICDNCLRQKTLTVSNSEFKQIARGIQQLILTAPQSPGELVRQLKNFEKEKVWKVISFLQAENKLTVTAEGLVSGGA